MRGWSQGSVEECVRGVPARLRVWMSVCEIGSLGVCVCVCVCVWCVWTVDKEMLVHR